MIKVITNSLGSGDWLYIKHHDEVVYEGHRPSVRDIKFMLELIGHKVEMIEVTDEQMEEGVEE
jgi:hypothetical protein